MRTMCPALIAIASICSSAVGCGGTATPAPRSVDPGTVPTITIAGESTVRRSPDVAYVVVSVQTDGPTSKEARQKNAVTMTGLHKRLEENHIPADAIRTVMYDLRREFDYVKGRQVPRQFVAQNTVEIRVDDLDRVGDLIDAMVAAGAYSVEGPNLALKDPASIQLEALKHATEDARAKAEAVAAGAGRSIDRVLRIEERHDAGDIAALPRVPANASTPAAVETPVARGQISATARVTLTASLK